MTLKAEWEKTDEFISIDDHIIRVMIKQSIPDIQLASYKIISGGCINLNIKLSFKNNDPDLILRIHLRDKEIALKEKALLHKISGKIPAPKVIYTGNLADYQYSVMEYIKGITLRDALLSNPSEDFGPLLFEVGVILSRMQGFHFEEDGDLNKNLSVIPHHNGQDYLSYAMNCLAGDNIKSVINSQEINSIRNYINTNRMHLPTNTQPTLVHGDYDPANILVDQIDGKWFVTGILDWEFAHSGSFLQDIANMLRYSHKLPDYYEKEFLRGLTYKGLILPSDWRKSINLLNLMALLDCLAREDPSSRPKRLKDILELIRHIILL